MNKTALKFLKLSVATFLFISIAMAVSGYYFYNHIYLAKLNSPTSQKNTPIKFKVNYGDSFRAVSMNLEKSDLITDNRILAIFARLNPDQINIKAGEYWLSPAMTPREIVRKLVSGDIILYSVTFPEGLTIKEMAQVWEQSGYGTAKRFLDAVTHYTDPEIETPESGWEGYIFPETYSFPEAFTETELIQKMVAQYKEILKPEHLAAAKELGLNRHEVTTLASLIEKETRLDNEHGLVSAVFHNRLRKGMLLQCDPTVIYALGDSYSGRLLKKHLTVDSPYNTYRYPELPPGPIAAPGRKALEAACYPADVNYLYFVADNSGGHTFSRTLKEHNIAVQAYRRGLKQK